MPIPATRPDLPTAWNSRRMRVLAAVAVLGAVAARGAVYLWWEQASFDSDQAVTGLMAKHLSEGQAFPLFYYGQNYLLAVQAWLAAPVFLALEPTVQALKLPLLLLNAVTALLLLRVLCDDVGLRPAAALLASAFFVMAPPGPAGQLMSALGVSVEPFLYVLLIWMLRDRPLWQGLALGVGFLHREFTAYGFLAILAVAALDRSLFTRGRVARGFGALLGSYLGLPLGLTPSPLSDLFVNSRLTPVAGLAGLAGLIRVIWLVERRIRLVRTDYWTGYRVAFLSQERVVTDTDGVWRVLQYHQWAAERPRSTYYVGRSACAVGGVQAVPGVYWVCPPPG